MADVNDIKAGDYELVADHWDETTSEPDARIWTYVRHYKGETVTLNEEDAKRLVLSGAVVEPGSRELAAAQRLRAQYQALLAQMPDELRAQLQESDPAKLAEQASEEEVPVENRTVGDEGSELQNEGDRPRVASASSGEGDGEIQPPAEEAAEPESPAKAANRRGRS